MKRFIPFLIVSVFWSCGVDELQDRIDGLDTRLAALEEQVASLNEEVSDLQALVSGKRFISGVSDNGDGSWTLTLVTAAGEQSEITVKDGEDGYSPQIGVKEDGGVMYWTLDGEFVLDGDGGRLPVSGNDGITPEFKIEDGYWYVSYGDGWQECGKAQADADYLVSLLKKGIKGQTIYDKALTAIILAKRGERQKGREYAQSLKEYTVYSDAAGRYYDTPRAGYSWRDYRIPTVVAAIEAITMITPEDSLTADEMRRWLLHEKRAQAWDTPINSVNAIHAFLSGGATLLAPKAASVLAIDGKLISLPAATAGVGYVKAAVADPQGKAFTATKTSGGTSWGALYAQELQEVGKLQAGGAGISIKRELITDSAALRVGSRVKVRITIKADRDMDFVQVADRRAACMEPVEQLTGYRGGAYCSPKDNATYYYFDIMGKGTHVVETEYYIDRAGRYETGTCTVGCAYAPEYRATAPSMTIEVKQ